MAEQNITRGNKKVLFVELGFKSNKVIEMKNMVCYNIWGNKNFKKLLTKHTRKKSK